MDDKLRRLERQVAAGDLDALHYLLVEHLRLGLLKPVDSNIAEYKAASARAAAKALDLKERRCYPTKRMTPAQRKEARKRRKKSFKFWG